MQSLKLDEDLGEGCSKVPTACIQGWRVTEKITIFLGVEIKLLANNLINLLSSIFFSSNQRMIEAAIPSKQCTREGWKLISAVVNESFLRNFNLKLANGESPLLVYRVREKCVL